MILLPFLVCFQWILLFGASLDYLWSFFKSKLAHAPFTDVHHVDVEGGTVLCTAVVSDLPSTNDQFRWSHLIFPWETIPTHPPPCCFEGVLSQYSTTLSEVWAWNQVNHPDSTSIQILEGENRHENSLPLKLTACYVHRQFTSDPTVSSFPRTSSSTSHQFCEHSVYSQYISCLLNVSQSFMFITKWLWLPHLDVWDF